MVYFSVSQLKEQVGLISQNGLIQILMWLVVLDIASGIVKSFKQKRSNSTTALFGIVKHALVLLLVMIVSVYLPLFGYSSASDWIVVYLIVTYLISFTENWVLIGLPAPQFIIEKLEKLKDVMDTGQKITIESSKDTVVKIETQEEKIND